MLLLLMGASAQPRLMSRGRGHVALVAPVAEVSGTGAGRQPGSRCPGEGSRQRAPCTRWHGAAGGREDAGGGRDRGFGDASVTLPLPGHLPLPSAERQHPCVRSLTSAGDAQPQPPACSVCFLSHFAKRLLIYLFIFFSTKSRWLPRGARVRAHYGRKRVQLPTLPNGPPVNTRGQTKQHKQQVATTRERSDGRLRATPRQ